MSTYTGKFPSVKRKNRNYMQLGDTGVNVMYLQKFLNWAYDANLKEDGKWGEKTNPVVIFFQTEVFGKEEADGLFGEKSLAAAKRYDKKENLQEEVTEPVVVSKESYKGTLPTLTLKKTNQQVIDDTIKWAKRIAKDNRFHYGYTNKHGSSDRSKWSPNAHHNGCYFCNTNVASGGRSKKGILDYKFTYCCNPFIGAAWAHGGCDVKAMSLCKNGGSWDFGTGAGSYHKAKEFKYMGHPAMSKLKPGYVLCNSYHVAMYIGDGKIVEAGGGDDNVRNSKRWNNSIRIRNLNTNNYKKFTRVYKYKSSVNTTANIKHGELSDRVKLWKAYLNWYFNKEVVTLNRYFDDDTLKYTKKFQKAVGMSGKGVVGKATLKKAASIVR